MFGLDPWRNGLVDPALQDSVEVMAAQMLEFAGAMRSATSLG